MPDLVRPQERTAGRDREGTSRKPLLGFLEKEWMRQGKGAHCDRAELQVGLDRAQCYKWGWTGRTASAQCYRWGGPRRTGSASVTGGAEPDALRARSVTGVCGPVPGGMGPGR